MTKLHGPITVGTSGAAFWQTSDGEDLAEQVAPRPDLTEARRLLDEGFKLVKLHHNSKRPVGDEWNKRPVTTIDPEATGYGMPLALNGLCSIDPDEVEMARAGLAAWDVDLEELLAAGVRTASTRPGSGGRSAFQAHDAGMARWIKLKVYDNNGNGHTVLELRAHSDNLQDCVPGLVYADKTGGICTQTYANGRTFDEAPELPDAFARIWNAVSSDPELRHEYERRFFDGIVAAGFKIDGKAPTFRPSMGGEGEPLAFPAKGYRSDYNQTHKVEDLLERHGYRWHGNVKRWSHPTATGAPGIRPIPGKDELWRSDHAGDPLSGTFDAWAAHVQLDHKGDVEAAKAAMDAERHRQAAQDFSGEQEAAQATAEEPSSTLPPIPEELLALPYGLGELQTHIFNSMIYPEPAAAGFTALAVYTAFAQTNITVNSYTGLGLNEYYMLLAPTGFGKESTRKPFERLWDLLEFDADAMVGLEFSAPSSKQALHEAIQPPASRSQMFLSDEFAEWLGPVSKGGNSSAHKQEAMGYLMELYTKALNKVHPGGAVTRKYEPVDCPRVSLFTTSTAEAMLRAMSADHADKGAYNRFCILPMENERIAKRYEGFDYTVSRQTIDPLAWMVGLPDKTVVEFRHSPDAWALFKEVDSAEVEPLRFKDGRMAGRLSEQAIKMAALIALSDRRLTIEGSDLEAAYRIRLGLYRRTAAMLEQSGAISGLHDTTQAVEQIKAVLRRKQTVYRSQLEAYSRKYKEMSVRDQKAVVDALVDGGSMELAPGSKKKFVSHIYQREGDK